MVLTSASSAPIATKSLLDSVGSEGKNTINSVYKIICPKTRKKGTGFLIKEGFIITNNHVIEECNENEIRVFSFRNNEIKLKKVINDKVRDLAILFPKSRLGGGLELIEEKVEPGIMVCTWGFPLRYRGPAPLLSTGFLAGFSVDGGVKKFIINGAFNEGNSGGPLLRAEESKVLGVVVSKHLPLLTPFITSAIRALRENSSGVVFLATDEDGNEKQFVESQLVAEILIRYYEMSQVVIGEAIQSCEVIKFLKENKLR